MTAHNNGSTPDRRGQPPRVPAFTVDPDPWPEPVDGAGLLDDLGARLLRHLSLPEGGCEAIALWILFTHCHDAFAISPILAATSPQKGCGKTTLLTLLSATVRRPLVTSNVSTASVFRTTDKYRPTLLIDEADTFLHAGDGQLLGVLNSGHQWRGAHTIRMDKRNGEFEPKVFSTWAPKAIAMIGQLPETLADRSVQIRMRRARRSDHIAYLRPDRLDDLEFLRRRAWRWAEDHVEALSHRDPPLPPGLSHRAADNWRPLLAIADQAGGGWPEIAREAAVILTDGLASQDLSTEVQLLEDIRQLILATGKDRLSSAEITHHLNDLEERPWGEWRNGKPLSTHQLARLLRPFEIKPRMLSMGRRGYEAQTFADAFDRYLPPLEAQGVQGGNDDLRRQEYEECNLGGGIALDHSTLSPDAMGGVARLALPSQGVDASPHWNDVSSLPPGEETGE